MKVPRREFIETLAGAGVGLWAQGGRARRLHDQFPDLARHFVFEYYPWYRVDPYYHWDQSDRQPPADVASNYMPRLGAYDSRDRRILEQHARWIAEVGVGAINVSWWGPGDTTDLAVPLLMDVMAAHDIHVTFHLEPYSERRAANYARDIQYLITEYGERRHWDCFLLLEHADGTVGPVFKSFFTSLPPSGVDCHGVRHDNPNYVSESVWRQQTDRVRDVFRHDFDRIVLLSDSLDAERTANGGFDGTAIYNNYVRPDSWPAHAESYSARDLVFSFNINPGFDAIVERKVEPGSCYGPPRFEPEAREFDWSRPADREAAARVSLARINESFQRTIGLQTASTLANEKQGFFLVYINSFNEWHEGHQFEPMKDAAALTPAERAVGYHNPANGMYRLNRLRELLEDFDL
jgi:hypothetical protein